MVPATARTTTPTRAGLEKKDWRSPHPQMTRARMGTTATIPKTRFLMIWLLTGRRRKRTTILRDAQLARVQGPHYVSRQMIKPYGCIVILAGLICGIPIAVVALLFLIVHLPLA